MPSLPGTPGTGLQVRQISEQQAYEGVALVRDVAKAWIETAAQSYLNLLWSQATLKTIEVRNLSDPLYVYTENIDEPGELFSLNNEGVSGRSAPVVSFRTGLAGRSYRGRAFLMPVPEGWQEDGRLVPAMLALEQDYLDDIRQIKPPGILENTYQHTVYSGSLSEIAGVVVDNLVTEAFPQPLLGSQRHRRRKVV